jgi:hypothetical protein
MVEFQRTRVREREPEGGDLYEISMAYQQAIRHRALHAPVVLKGSERPYTQSRQGFAQYFLCRDTPDLYTALKDWVVFIHEIHRHSGKHRHQGGIALFVLEGEGYTTVDGERIDWEAGDLICLPAKPGGCEHQHFNRNPNVPAKWIAFIYKPMHDELGSYLEQRETSPEFKG